MITKLNVIWVSPFVLFQSVFIVDMHTIVMIISNNELDKELWMTPITSNNSPNPKEIKYEFEPAHACLYKRTIQ